MDNDGTLSVVNYQLSIIHCIRAGGDSGVAVTWKTRPLGELFKTAAGGTPSTLNRAYYDGGTVPWLLSGAVRVGVIREATTFITDLGLENCNAKMFPRETVLVALYGATAGQVGILDIEASTNQAVLGIYPNKSFLPKFIFYLLLSSYDALVAQAIGNAQPNISGQKVKNVPVPLLSLPEQQRIVGILDEAFAGIATARANAEKNLRNARELLESELQAVFTRGGDGWIEMRLGDIADFKNGLNFNQSSRGQSVRVVGVGDFYQNYDVPLSELQSVTIDDKLDKGYEIREGDLLTVRSNGSKDLVGRCMLVPPVNDVISYSGFVIRIRCDQSVIVPRFLLHFMKSRATRDRLTRDGGGANISNINQDKLSALTLGVPPVKSQMAVAGTLDRFVVETQRLEAVYEKKLAALDALKKSLLHDAFNGKLTMDNGQRKH